MQRAPDSLPCAPCTPRRSPPWWRHSAAATNIWWGGVRRGRGNTSRRTLHCLSVKLPSCCGNIHVKEIPSSGTQRSLDRLFFGKQGGPRFQFQKRNKIASRLRVRKHASALSTRTPRIGFTERPLSAGKQGHRTNSAPRSERERKDRQR